MSCPFNGIYLHLIGNRRLPRRVRLIWQSKINMEVTTDLFDFALKVDEHFLALTWRSRKTGSSSTWTENPCFCHLEEFWEALRHSSPLNKSNQQIYSWSWSGILFCRFVSSSNDELPLQKKTQHPSRIFWKSIINQEGWRFSMHSRWSVILSLFRSIQIE